MDEQVTLEELRALSVEEALGLGDLAKPQDALACPCACHLRRFGRPQGDLHAGGRDCPCQQSPQERRAAFAQWLEEWQNSDAAHALSEASEREREEAVRLAAELGMTVTVESQWVPTIIAGSLRGTGYWFRERHDVWRLHLDDHDGPVIARGAVPDEGGGLAWAVATAHEHLDRHLRRAACRHDAPADSAFCPRCGDRLPAAATDQRRGDT